MALIVRGKMPTCCGGCDASGTGACKVWMNHRKDLSEGIPSGCPIIGEIPDKCGRLIIADALLEKLEKIALPDDLTYTIAHGILKQIIEDAPTILEATE